MVERSVVIKNETGIHARPASQFIACASKFDSKIELIRENKTANAKSILNVLTLGLNKGVEVLVRADGPDEQEALDTVIDFIENLEE